MKMWQGSWSLVLEERWAYLVGDGEWNSSCFVGNIYCWWWRMCLLQLEFQAQNFALLRCLSLQIRASFIARFLMIMRVDFVIIVIILSVIMNVNIPYFKVLTICRQHATTGLRLCCSQLPHPHPQQALSETTLITKVFQVEMTDVSEILCGKKSSLSAALSQRAMMQWEFFFFISHPPAFCTARRRGSCSRRKTDFSTGSRLSFFYDPRWELKMKKRKLLPFPRCKLGPNMRTTFFLLFLFLTAFLFWWLSLWLRGKVILFLAHHSHAEISLSRWLSCHQEAGRKGDIFTS